MLNFYYFMYKDMIKRFQSQNYSYRTIYHPFILISRKLEYLELNEIAVNKHFEKNYNVLKYENMNKIK